MRALRIKARVKAEECRWQELFNDPAMWWDNRGIKRSSKSPDFVHKNTGEGLWTDSIFSPDWLPEKLNCLQRDEKRGSGAREDMHASEEKEPPRAADHKEARRELQRPSRRDFFDEARRKPNTSSSYTDFQAGKRIHVTIASLKSCITSRDLQAGRRIHAELLSSGDDSDILISTTLVDMYAKCGDMQSARNVFDKMQKKDAVSWNAIIMGYVQSGHGDEAMELFNMMQEQGVVPVARTFVAVINACRILGWLEKGKEIHRRVSESGVETDLFVANSLLDMYAKCGSMDDAKRLVERMPVRDVVSWTCMISGYAQVGEGDEGLRCFTRMQEEDKMVPDGRTYVAVFKACTALAAKERGVLITGKVVKTAALEKAKALHADVSSELDVFMSNALVDLYSKCGSMPDAQQVFDRMSHRTVVSWTTLILGYVQGGENETALSLFEVMKGKRIPPNALTYCAVLKGCGNMAAVEIGRRIHGEIRKADLEHEPVVVNSLVSFYGKCGSMDDAKVVFDSAPARDLVTWNALMAGYSYQGDVRVLVKTFHDMRNARVSPDGVTFLSLLTGCSHAGLVDKGMEYFRVMKSEFGLSPGVEHYTCMVDLLGRGKKLDEALDMVRSMPFEADMMVWMTILSACRKWTNVSIGKVAFDAVVKIENADAAVYVLMSSIYSAAGMVEESLSIETLRRECKAWKKPGQSWWVDGGGKVHKFVVGETEHPQVAEIRAKLSEVHARMKEAGYVPQLESVSHDIAEGEKEMALCEHSERLAIGCALLNTPPGTPIRIVKNLRVCSDCHSATAVLSKVEGRVVTCRDNTRFHVFENGRCSCGDFW